jgi:Flp pilus assembly pilin Flp
MESTIFKLLKDEKGATLIEYELLLVLIMVVCATVVALVGTRTIELFIFSW